MVPAFCETGKVGTISAAGVYGTRDAAEVRNGDMIVQAKMVLCRKSLKSQTFWSVSRVCAGYQSFIVRSWVQCSGSCVVFGCLLVAVASECDAPIDTRKHVGLHTSRHFRLVPRMTRS